MKSWADHCSSDEEEDDIPRVSTLQSSDNLKEQDESSSDGDVEEEIQGFHLPDNPPFTAFVGNLSFEIQDAKHLAYELERLCEVSLSRQVTAVDGRLMFDRETGKKKGFGYVEFETREDLATVLELNNRAELYGRKVRVDVANAPKNPRSGGSNRRLGRNQSNASLGSDRNDNYNKNSNRQKQLPEIDGSLFRGGKYNRNNSNISIGSNLEEGPKTRPMLKLAPRSKPLEEGHRQSHSQSSLFGGAKPRDEAALATNATSVPSSKSMPMPTPTAILKPNRNQSHNVTPTSADVMKPEMKPHASQPDPSKNSNADGNSAQISSLDQHEDKLPSSEKDAVLAHATSNSARRGAGNDRNERRRGSGRGNKDNKRSGGRGNGAGGGTGRRDSKKKNDKHPKGRRRNPPTQQKSSDGWDEPQQTSKTRSISENSTKNRVEEIKPKKNPTKVMNAFAALDFDDSDSD